MIELNNDNLIVFAAKGYQNIQCQDTDEFHEDLNRFKYVKKLVNRFLKHNENDDDKKVFQLILNHIIIIYNVFETEAAHKLIKFRLEEKQLTVVKPILLFLSYITTKDFLDTPLDQAAVEQCRKI